MEDTAIVCLVLLISWIIFVVLFTYFANKRNSIHLDKINQLAKGIEKRGKRIREGL